MSNTVGRRVGCSINIEAKNQLGLPAWTAEDTDLLDAVYEVNRPDTAETYIWH
jgi:hypothetical protein